MLNEMKIPDNVKVLEQVSAKKAMIFIVVLSVVAVLFLFWLIYFKGGAETNLPWVKNLPAVNASLNFLSTVLLLFGFRAILKKEYQKHLKFMVSAFLTSALFLVSYIVYHHFQGDTKFGGEGIVMYVYFFILITHIILSIFVVPLVLSSFYFSLSGKFNIHKKVSRFTFPIWLYVSVTGVIIYFMLKHLG